MEVVAAMREQATDETTQRASGRVAPGRPELAAADLPLARYPVFQSHDLEETREQMARTFCPHELSLVGGATGLDARQHNVRLNSVSMNYVRYGGDVRIVPGELESFFVVQMPLSGYALFSCGNSRVLLAPGLAAVPCPTEPLAMWWSADCAQLVVRIERPALEAELSDLLNRPVDHPIRFDLGMELISPPTRSWQRAARLLVADLDRGNGLATHPSTIVHFEHLLMTGLLVVQPHNYTPLLAARQKPCGSRAVREAVELIEAHPERPLTVTALAREVAVSVRSLQNGFQRTVGCSPSQYLRAVRLRRAHEELLAEKPDRVTVTDVAYRWGFAHMGRFSATYRRRYGESPSQTLRR